MTSNQLSSAEIEEACNSFPAFKKGYTCGKQGKNTAVDNAYQNGYTQGMLDMGKQFGKGAAYGMNNNTATAIGKGIAKGACMSDMVNMGKGAAKGMGKQDLQWVGKGYGKSLVDLGVLDTMYSWDGVQDLTE
jgi:hypothetical protein